MVDLTQQYISSHEAADFLGIHPMAVQKLFQSGRLPAGKIANRWVVRRRDVERFALTYEGRPGRPRKRRRARRTA